MALTQLGRDVLIAREALKTVAYLDTAKPPVWTIGVGHTSAAGPPIVTQGLKITRAQALEIFARDLTQYEAAVDRAVTVPMADHERDAFVSICYNIGGGAFTKSTFVKRFNAGDKAGCAEAIMRFVKPASVTSRRAGERDQFLTPYTVRKPSARAGERASVKPAPEALLATPPVVATVAPSGKRPGLLGFLFGKKIGVPEIVGTKGDPTLYYVQTILRDKAYYTKGLPDGIDGGMTQSAVAQSRKDNGMEDGGIDAEFLARLPAFPQRPVSQERATMGLAAAAQHAPELFSGAKWLGGLGMGSVGLGGLSDLVDQGKDVAGKVNDLAAQAQTATGYVTWAFAFLAEHKMIVLIAVGAFAVLKAVSIALNAWIKVRQAFF